MLFSLDKRLFILDTELPISESNLPQRMKGMLHGFNKGGLAILEATMAAYEEFGSMFNV